MNDERKTNREQYAAWNEASGRAWVELQEVLDRVMAPFADRLLDEASPGAGARVLDIGCGAGATTLAAARRLGPSGLCLGVDISAPLLAAAEARATAEGLRSAAFLQADAQDHAFEPHAFDAVLSRFGVMFFDDPVAAFANIRRAARPAATLAFVAWRSPEDNPFMTTAAVAAAPFLPELPPPAPDAPGPFAFANDDRVRRILDASGWTDVDARPLDVACSLAEKELLTYATKLGPAARALREMDAATFDRASAAIRAAFEPYVREGRAHFVAKCWLVTARSSAAGR
jgi:SAM-dependent methyltransferase